MIEKLSRQVARLEQLMAPPDPPEPTEITLVFLEPDGTIAEEVHLSLGADSPADEGLG